MVHDRDEARRLAEREVCRVHAEVVLAPPPRCRRRGRRSRRCSGSRGGSRPSSTSSRGRSRSFISLSLRSGEVSVAVVVGRLLLLLGLARSRTPLLMQHVLHVLLRDRGATLHVVVQDVGARARRGWCPGCRRRRARRSGGPHRRPPHPSTYWLIASQATSSRFCVEERREVRLASRRAGSRRCRSAAAGSPIVEVLGQVLEDADAVVRGHAGHREWPGSPRR